MLGPPRRRRWPAALEAANQQRQQSVGVVCPGEDDRRQFGTVLKCPVAEGPERARQLECGDASVQPAAANTVKECFRTDLRDAFWNRQRACNRK